VRYLQPIGMVVVLGLALSFLGWSFLRPAHLSPAHTEALPMPAQASFVRNEAVAAEEAEAGEQAAEAAEELMLPETPSWPDAHEIESARLQIRVDSVTRAEEELPQARTALAKNDPAAAAQHFSALIADKPQHLEARLNLAEMAARQGDFAIARLHYQAVLKSQPQNARAAVGMALIMAESGEIGVDILEGLLRRLLAEQPTVAAAHFALGNLFASQGRWQEAEEAYFAAYRLEAGNPDYRFNLAVSLDALGAGKAAAEFYQAALVAAKTLPHVFLREAAEKRLAQLDTP